jgi:hypothetical protein
VSTDSNEVDKALSCVEAAFENPKTSMSSDNVPRLFAFSFAVGQLGQNLRDLADRCADLLRARIFTHL